MVRVLMKRLETFMNKEFWSKGVKFGRFTRRLQREPVRRHLDAPRLRLKSQRVPIKL